MIHPYTPEIRMQLRKPVNRSRERALNKEIRGIEKYIRRRIIEDFTHMLAIHGLFHRELEEINP